MTRTVLCFGDSNTHGTIALEKLGQFNRMDRATRWPGRLAEALPDWHVVEEGHPGRTTLHDDPIEGAHRNGLTVLPSLLESHRPLDLVVLMLGTNDLKPRFSVTATDIALSIEKLIATIQASNAGPSSRAPQILLVAPVPITETGVLKGIFEGGAAKSQELSLLYQLTAERTGAAFLDAGKLGATDPRDGVHLSTDMHAKLAEAITQKIQEEFPLQS